MTKVFNRGVLVPGAKLLSIRAHPTRPDLMEEVHVFGRRREDQVVIDEVDLDLPAPVPNPDPPPTGNVHPFVGFTPRQSLVVATSDSADFVLSRLRALGPGTVAQFKPGTHATNLSLGGLQGLPDAPYVFESLDPSTPAVLRPYNTNRSTVQAHGAENLWFRHLSVMGPSGQHDSACLKFTQAGEGFVDLCRNIVLDNIVARESGGDVVKCAQVVGFYAVGCELSHNAAEQTLDLVACHGGAIVDNWLHHSRGQFAMVLKGGSSDFVVRDNVLEDVQDGILVGGVCNPVNGIVMPVNGTVPPYAARNIHLRDNVVRRATKRGVLFIGAVDCKVEATRLDQMNREYSCYVGLDGNIYGPHPTVKCARLSIVGTRMSPSRAQSDSWLRATNGESLGEVTVFDNTYV